MTGKTTIDDLRKEIHAAVDSGQTLVDVLAKIAEIYGRIGIDIEWIDHLKPRASVEIDDAMFADLFGETDAY